MRTWSSIYEAVVLAVVAGLMYLMLLLLAFEVNWITGLLNTVFFLVAAAAIAHFASIGLAFFKPSIGRWWYAMSSGAIFTVLHLFLVQLLWFVLPFSTEFHTFSPTTSGVLNALIFWPFLTVFLHNRMLHRELMEQQELESMQVNIKHLEKEAELKNLRHRMQPHFLFNALNSINALIDLDGAKARNMVQQLSTFLRGTIQAEEARLQSMEEELAHMQLYLDIEQVRFEHRLKVSIDCESEACNMKLPVLLLQPLLENAIKFGLYGTTEQVLIRLTAKAENGLLRVSISNPIDEDHEAQRGTGFGLRSIQKRLQLIYGRTDLMEHQLKNEKYVVNLKIPQP